MVAIPTNSKQIFPSTMVKHKSKTTNNNIPIRKQSRGTEQEWSVVQHKKKENKTNIGMNTNEQKLHYPATREHPFKIFGNSHQFEKASQETIWQKRGESETNTRGL